MASALAQEPRRRASIGVVDEVAPTPRQAVQEGRSRVIATPVGQMPEVMATIAPVPGQPRRPCRWGSTKQDVIAYASGSWASISSASCLRTRSRGRRKRRSRRVRRLYRGRNVILAPQPETSDWALEVVRRAWEACGARVIELEAVRHDEIFAAVSHLPHVVAFALVSMLAKRGDAETLLGHSGGGLRDTVRIAGSSPEMWRDICIANRDALIDVLDAYMEELELARGALEAGDGAALESMFEAARTARRRWLLKEQA